MDNVDDDDIDKLKLPAALKLARERNISIRGIKDLEKIKCELKKHLLEGRRRREDVIEELMKDAKEDSMVRHKLIEVYKKTIDSLECYTDDDPLLKSVSKCYKKSNVIDMLRKRKGKLDGRISRCPILVLGDTGAGKSSFINLLLGEEVFPCSLLSNTSVICEISYCETPHARLHPHDDEEDNACIQRIGADSMENFDLRQLSQLVQERDEVKRRSKYKKAEIFFPLPILQTGLIIVDSPGVGDTPEMTQLVLDYVMEASAFVFIINTIDGVQTSRLEMLLTEIAERVMKEDKYYKEDCTLFICNKWDQVPIDERSKVHEEALKKLQKVWIGFKPSNLYTLSTKEALYIQKDGLIVGRFEKILQGIINLLPPSREQLLTTTTGVLYDFLNNCMTCIETHIHRSKINPQAIQNERDEIQTRMTTLKDEVNQFFEEQKSGLKSSLSKISEELSKYLRSDKVKPDLINFNADDPELANKSFQQVSVVVRSRVYDGISKHIKSWEEQQKQLEDIGRLLIQKFHGKFPDFEAKLFRVEKLFRNSWSNDSLHRDSDSALEDSIPLVPNVISDHFNNLNLGLKVILSVALSPVFLIGVIVRLPYWGVKQLGSLIKNEMLTRNFEKGKDKGKVIKEYATSVIDKMTEKNMIDSCLAPQLDVLYHYIDSQRQKVIDQVNNKLAMLNYSDSDDACDFDIPWVKSKSTIDKLCENLEYFNMVFLPQNLKFQSSKRFEITSVFSEGVITKVVLARDTETNQRMALRQCKLEVNINNIKQYQKEETYYRKPGKPHMITVDLLVKCDMHIWQCFPPPKQSLSQFMSDKKFEKYDNSKLKFYCDILSQVATGLQYIHKKSLVHIDLCQDTVLIGVDGRVVLVNLFCPTKLEESWFDKEDENVQNFTHFHFDIIKYTNITVYEQHHDIYSLGILMLELWSQQPAFKNHIIENSILNLEQFCDFIKQFDVQSCLPYSDNSTDITSIDQTWQDVLISCLSTPRTMPAHKWLDSFSHHRFSLEFVDQVENLNEADPPPAIVTARM